MTKIVVLTALVAGLSGVSLAPALADSGSYNGTWSVDLTTDSGMCSSHTTYAVSVVDGAVRSAGGGGARMSGQVTADGTVGLSVSNAIGSGTGAGRLGAQTGSGTWKAGSMCSGRWTARRQTTRTAQAN